MRKTVLAALTTAVVVTLSLGVTAGTAFAAAPSAVHLAELPIVGDVIGDVVNPTPAPTPTPESTTTTTRDGLSVGAEVELGSETTTSTPTSVPPIPLPTPVPCTVDQNPRAPGCQNSGPIFGGGNGFPRGGGWNGHWNDRFDSNRFIVLDNGPRLDVCVFADFGDLVRRNGVFRDRLDGLFGNDGNGRFRTLRSGCGASNTVIFNDRFDNNRFIVLDNGPRLDVCAFADFGDLVRRNGGFRDRFDNLFGSNRDSRFLDLRRGSCGNSNGVIFSGDGDCQTLITTVGNYRSSVGRWNDLSRRFHGLGASQLSVHRGDLVNAARDRFSLSDRFNRLRPTVRTVCSAPTSLNTIFVEPAPVNFVLPSSVQPISVTTDPAAPMDADPASSSSGNTTSGGPTSQVGGADVPATPRGAETGDGSLVA